jgi:hypothetical protein
VRQTLGGLCVAAAAGALAVSMLHHTTLKGVAVAIVVVGSLWFATTRHTQLALAVLMLYLGLLDGYLKLATGSGAVTFVRDAFLFALVIGLFVRATVQGKRLPLPPLSGWLIAFSVLVLVQLANPQAGTLVHSLAGVRQHLEFVPLFFLTAAFVRTTRALRIFCILLAVIAGANAIAGWVQFNESPQQFAAWGPGYSQRVLGTGSFAGSGRTFSTGVAGAAGHTRPFGLGSDAGDGGVFCMLALCGILALASFTGRRRDQLFAVAMALAAVLGIVTSEGRGVIVSAVIALIAFGLLTITARNRLTSLLGLALAVLASLFAIHAIVSAAASSGLRYAGLTPTSILSTTSKARGLSISRIPHNLITYPFGAGLGTAGPASSAPGASQLTLTGNIDAETEFSYLLVEAGIPGMLVVTGFTVTLLLLGFRGVRREPDREAQVLLAALIASMVSLFALFFSSAVTSSVPTAPFLWGVGGIVSYWLITLPGTRRREAAGATRLPPAAGGPPARRWQSPRQTPARSAAQ